MWVLFAALSAALLLTCIWQRIQYRKLQKEINYISNRLETLSITSENGFVLLPTDHACMKKLGATINTLHSLRLEWLYLLSRRKCQNYINSICRATAKKKSRRSTDTIHAYLLLRRL